MRIKLSAVHQSAKTALAVLAIGSLLFGQQGETSTTRLLKSSEADQIAYLNNYIAEGMPIPNDDVESLILSKTSPFVPLLEQKIEEIVHSSSRERLFKNQSIVPERVVTMLVSRLAENPAAGTSIAGKLLTKALDGNAPEDVRAAAIEAIGTLKLTSLKAQLIPLLDDESEKVVGALMDIGVRR